MKAYGYLFVVRLRSSVSRAPRIWDLFDRPESRVFQHPVRYLMLMIAACLLTSCGDVVVVNPRTGETATCSESLTGLNPWSQKEACVAGYIAQGWNRSSRD